MHTLKGIKDSPGFFELIEGFSEKKRVATEDQKEGASKRRRR